MQQLQILVIAAATCGLGNIVAVCGEAAATAAPHSGSMATGDLGGGDSPAAIGPNQPAEQRNLFAKMSDSTRSFFARARRALSGRDSSRAASTPVNKRQTSPRLGFGLGSLFRSNTPPAPRTVDEWLSLKRPEAL
jgi:hypothetical protein